MTDSGIEELYALADAAFRNGQPSFHVHIFPFRLTAESLARHADDAWMDFWLNLQEGYSYFELTGHLPGVSGRGGRYFFNKGVAFSSTVGAH